jgi:hypothetical protein
MESVQTTSAQSRPKDVTATLNYIGDVEGKPRFNVYNMADSNVSFRPHQVIVRDARPYRDTLRIDETGFAFVKQKSSVDLEEVFDANLTAQPIATGVTAIYEREIADFLQETTGAREVFRRMGGLVTRTSKRGANIKTKAYPANFVHLDFTDKASRQFLEWTLESEGRTVAPFRRFCVYQVWRAITPGPQDTTLAVCDGSSVPVSHGLVVDSILGPEHLPGNRFDSRMCRYAPEHKWWYLSDMEPDDLIVFKSFDSEMPHVMNAMHTAFDNPLGQDGVPRRSIESRFIALYD